MRLISFLGLGEPKRDSNGKPTGEFLYQKTHYRFNQDPATDIETCYIGRAITQNYNLVEVLRSGDLIVDKVDDVILLATEKAESAHKIKILKEFEEANLPIPQLVNIPHGANTQEQWLHFNTLLNYVPVGKDKRVVFDITHGFRAQPFFAAAVINYIRATWVASDIPQMYVLYGEYNQERGVSDIWDMTNFINLVDWSSALQVFIRTGHGSQLGTLAERQARDLRKSGHQDATVLINLANSLTAFSQNIATVRVPDIITGSDSVVGSAKNVLKCIEFSEETVKDYFLPLVSLIELLKVQLKPLVADSLFSPIGMLAMLNLAKMYVDYERYPEAAVVIREGWVSLYADSTQTDSFLLNRQQREKIEDFWRQAELHQLGGTGEADFLSNIRNDIQHGGFRPNSLSAKSLIKNINKLIMDFSKKLEISSNKIF